MGEVHYLGESGAETHIVFPALDGSTHVLPVSMLDNWISGSVPFDAAQNNVLLRSIINDWKVRSLGLEEGKKGK